MTFAVDWALSNNYLSIYQYIYTEAGHIIIHTNVRLIKTNIITHLHYHLMSTLLLIAISLCDTFTGVVMGTVSDLHMLACWARKVRIRCKSSFFTLSGTSAGDKKKRVQGHYDTERKVGH